MILEENLVKTIIHHLSEINVCSSDTNLYKKCKLLSNGTNTNNIEMGEVNSK